MPTIEAVALDISPTMLEAAREHFVDDSKVKIIVHDLNQPLPDSSLKTRTKAFFI